MASKELIDYIRSSVSQGYAIASIRANLIGAGYPPQQIDEAIAEAFHPTRSPLKFVIAGVACAILLVALIYGLVLLLAPSEVGIKISVADAPASLRPGTPFVFSRSISTGVKDPYAVDVIIEIHNDQTRERIISQSEQVQVRGSAVKKSSLVLPPTLRSGDYVLTVTARIGDEQSVATHRFTFEGIATPGTTPTGKPPLLGTTPTTPSVPSGAPGVCKPSCNDYDPCTLDKCTDGRCLFEAKSPCCGNFECETGETEASCAQDCKVRPLTQGEAIMEVRKRAEDQAASNTGDAVNLCKSIAVVAQADSCLKTVAFAAERSDVCKSISGTKLRDACYLDFALKNKQSAPCEEVSDRWMKQSCLIYTNAPQQQ
ncbi:MAG TPA: hypothetical protein VJH22_03335 [Candidatus Nanoarchaeia archaeon]|nr:hypothetical protein [Candidatus Nanoarchaeia archaeon]